MSNRTDTADDRNAEHHVMWRCLDTEGVDACWFSQTTDGWLISGTALFKLENKTARLDYQVSCDKAWNSVAAQISGLVGTRKIEFDLSKTDSGGWQLNGSPVAHVDGLLDVDLGFTPATNTTAMKRLDLPIGGEAETRAVWLDIGDWTFKPLPQIYVRNSDQSYTYKSPGNDYQTDLVVDAFGLVRLYPGLWQAI